MAATDERSEALNESDEQLFAKARAHMESYAIAASLDRRLWDATVRIALRSASAGSERAVAEKCAEIASRAPYGSYAYNAIRAYADTLPAAPKEPK